MLLVERILMIHLLKRVQNRIEADFFLDGQIRVFFEAIEQLRLIRVVKGVDDFISEANVTVNRINRCSEWFA